MGQLISAIRGKDIAQVYIDFENAQPTSGELTIYTRVQEVLSRAPAVLALLEEYKGCQDLARKAMSTPTLANETEAFEGLLDSVKSIATFFSFSRQVEEVVPDLLLALSRGPTEDAKASFSDQQALVKQFAELLNFALTFDQTRMNRPFLSNDFSYYRRLLPKFAKHPGVIVKDDDASGMALFTAEHIPMTTSIAKAAASALEKNTYVLNALALMSNSCYSMLQNRSFTRQDINLFVARAMTGSLVCYDHVDPSGVFNKKSPIKVKSVVVLLKKDFPQENGLINAIRYSTKHAKDADEKTQALFD